MKNLQLTKCVFLVALRELKLKCVDIHYVACDSFFSKLSRADLEPTQPLVQKVLGFFPVGKAVGI